MLLRAPLSSLQRGQSLLEKPPPTPTVEPSKSGFEGPHHPAESPAAHLPDCSQLPGRGQKWLFRSPSRSAVKEDGNALRGGCLILVLYLVLLHLPGSLDCITCSFQHPSLVFQSQPTVVEEALEDPEQRASTVCGYTEPKALRRRGERSVGGWSCAE